MATERLISSIHSNKTLGLKSKLMSEINFPNQPIKKLSKYPWFALGMWGVVLLSLGLRFWNMNFFNTLVFDEGYYATYGVNYLDKVPFFDAHPPLGKYAISAAIWIASHLPFNTGIPNGLTGIMLSPFSYRWLNAVVGSFLPLVVGGIAYQISGRRLYAFLATLFTALDGLLLVESRFALINIYLVFFGLLAQLLLLIALNNRGFISVFWLFLSGICFGSSISVKWNGLGFLLGIFLTWLVAQIAYAWRRKQEKLNRPIIEIINPKTGIKSFELSSKIPLPLPLLQKRFIKLPLWKILLFLGIVPAAVYYAVWQPHLAINTDTNFIDVHQKIFNFHKGLKSGKDIHPYCSRWYTWPLMWRPMVYLFEKALSLNEKVPEYPSLPEGVGKIYYDVHGMGNPALWTLSALAILLLFVVLINRLFIWYTYPENFNTNEQIFHFPTPAELWLVCFIVFNYAANFLPWVIVTRCTFIYLYMPASVFAFMAIAWLVERWLRSYKIAYRAAGITVIFVIAIAFVFWMPIYLGLPLSSAGFNLRMWLESWI